ncbi:hypothetical protein BDW71DRAFT_47845 [Aspergillus fruticulosus]
MSLINPTDSLLIAGLFGRTQTQGIPPGSTCRVGAFWGGYCGWATCLLLLVIPIPLRAIQPTGVRWPVPYIPFRRGAVICWVCIACAPVLIRPGIQLAPLHSGGWKDLSFVATEVGNCGMECSPHQGLVLGDEIPALLGVFHTEKVGELPNHPLVLPIHASSNCIS